jgi:hypothetical protein
MANHARISFSVPKPPSHTETYNNPDETLTWITKRILEILSSQATNQTPTKEEEEPTLDRTAYLVIYSTIHDLAARSRSPQYRPGPSQGERLYYSLADISRNHCKHLRVKILQERYSDSDAADHDLAVMQSYVEEFRRYRALAGLMAHLFSNVDKHWCKQMLDEGRLGVYQIRDLLMRIWKEEVIIGGRGAEQKEASVESTFGSLLNVAVSLRERSGRTAGGVVDQVLLDLIDEGFGSFDEVGVVVVGTWVAERFYGVDPRSVRRERRLSGLKIVHLV